MFAFRHRGFRLMKDSPICFLQMLAERPFNQIIFPQFQPFGPILHGHGDFTDFLLFRSAGIYVFCFRVYTPDMRQAHKFMRTLIYSLANYERPHVASLCSTHDAIHTCIDYAFRV